MRVETGLRKATKRSKLILTNSAEVLRTLWGTLQLFKELSWLGTVGMLEPPFLSCLKQGNDICKAPKDLNLRLGES